MGAQVSQAMKKARKLLAANPNMPQAEIARKSGLHRSAVGKDATCRAILDQRKKEKHDGEVDAKLA